MNLSPVPSALDLKSLPELSRWFVQGMELALPLAGGAVLVVPWQNGNTHHLNGSTGWAG